MSNIHKHVDGDITECLYDSGNVIASKYNKESKKLVLIFGKGGQYLYEGVENNSYNNFETSKSQGSAVHTIIKTHKTTKLAPINVEPIKEQISQIIKENAKPKPIIDDKD